MLSSNNNKDNDNNNNNNNNKYNNDNDTFNDCKVSALYTPSEKTNPMTFDLS